MRELRFGEIKLCSQEVTLVGRETKLLVSISSLCFLQLSYPSWDRISHGSCQSCLVDQSEQIGAVTTFLT